MVQEADLMFVTSEALVWLYVVCFFSDWIREERKGTDRKYPSTTEQFLAKLNASQNTQHELKWGYLASFSHFQLPPGHNSGYFSVY